MARHYLALLGIVFGLTNCGSAEDDGASGAASDLTGGPAQQTDGDGTAQDFHGKAFPNQTLLWEGDWSFLTQCDSFSKANKQVVFTCDEKPTRDFVDNGNWIAVPHVNFSRTLCKKNVKLCKGDTCVVATVMDRGVSSHFEGSTAVLKAFDVKPGFRSCNSSEGTATGISITFQ